MHKQTAIVLDVKEEEKNICNIKLHYIMLMMCTYFCNLLMFEFLFGKYCLLNNKFFLIMIVFVYKRPSRAVAMVPNRFVLQLHLD